MHKASKWKITWNLGERGYLNRTGYWWLVEVGRGLKIQKPNIVGLKIPFFWNKKIPWPLKHCILSVCSSYLIPIDDRKWNENKKNSYQSCNKTLFYLSKQSWILPVWNAGVAVISISNVMHSRVTWILCDRLHNINLIKWDLWVLYNIAAQLSNAPISVCFIME